MLEDCRILYVEDDKDMQKYMEIILEDDIKELYLASDGLEGIEIYKSQKPDIVISDIGMPNMDGIEMSKEIRKIDSKQLIILLTAYSNNLTKKEIDMLNITATIPKPIEDLEVLFEIIEDNCKERDFDA